MSAIFGIFHRSGQPAALETLEKMAQGFASWPSAHLRFWVDGPVGFGHLLTFNTPEARFEQLPRFDSSSGVALTAAVRVDNRQDLFDRLNIPSAQRHSMPDGDLLLSAYRCWEAQTPRYVYGDWAFAAWHRNERKLFLARDHHGHGSIYYYSDPSIFAFASSRKPLLALNMAPAAMDELYLAQVLVAWTAYYGERTIHQGIRRLPPAHWLTVTPAHEQSQRYWYLEHVPELRLSSREDYVEGFREVFDEAVRTRLRSDAPVSVTLSGGLDSGSVTATAALLLRPEGKRLAAFTSVPKWDTTAYVGERFGDELPFAQATAQYAGNVDHYLVHGNSLSPLEAIRLSLDIHDEAMHAAGNAFWMLELFDTARRHGLGTLLTGQLGNASISWGERQQDFGRRQLWIKACKKAARHMLPLAARLRYSYRRWKTGRDFPTSAIRPDFARRLQLKERIMAEKPVVALQTPRERRYEILKPGSSLVGSIYTELSGAFGLEIRDPTADTRVLEFVIAVPDAIFYDPKTGLDRWLIRTAMQGRLPDEVRLNTRRGRQAGDLVQRLRAESTAVEASLDELARGQAAEYVDVPYLRETWQLIQRSDTPEAFNKAVTILTRGIMAGMFVNQMAIAPEHIA